MTANQRNQIKGPNVKGLSIKQISDWLKKNEYLEDIVDKMTGEKITRVTDAGKEKGIYTELCKSRFGQEYEVIMYSEDAQLWIVDNMSMILNA